MKFYNIRCSVCVWLCLAKRPEQCAPHIINIYTSLPLRVSLVHPVLLFHRHYSYGRSTAALSSSGAHCRSIENAILLYCTLTHILYIYIQPLWRFNRETTTFRRPPVEYHRRHRFAPQTHHTYPPPPSHRPTPIFSLSKIYYHHYTGTWPPVDIFAEAVVVTYTRVYIITQAKEVRQGVYKYNIIIRRRR